VNWLPRAWIKRIPGAERVYRSLVRTPGSWIFSRRKLAWVMAGGASRALPGPFRAFVRYCRIAPETRRGRLVGAELLHLLAVALTRRLGLPDTVRVDAGPYLIHLDLTDPRALVVPGEMLDSPETRFLTGLLAPGDTFVDIGANHGSFSVVAARQVGASGRIIAVEPQPRLARLVEMSLEDNCQCPFTVLPIACADEEGEALFFVPARSSGSASLYRPFTAKSAGHRLRVTVRRFDDAVDWRDLPGRVVMKVDVEGAELSFLEGARQALSHLRPQIILEVNPFSAQAAGTSIREVADHLRALDYDAFRELGDSTPRSLDALDARRSRNVVLLPRAAVRL
jgi:FkbM family methyltransferase